MDTFTEAYEKGIGLLKSKCFDPRWARLETRLKALMGHHGPNDGEAEVLNDIRQKLEDSGDGADDSGYAVAEEMLDLCREADRGYQERAAFLEMLRHFYLVRLTHNHRVWILDGTLKFHRWIFDEFDGQTRHELKRLLAHEPFLAFGSDDRQMFAEALQRARKWSMDIVADLGHPDQDTLDVVRRWFHSGHTSDVRVKATARTLLDGFKRIAALCNSTQIIFSDDPPNRARHKDGSLWDAAVYPTEKMPVIYLYPGYLKNARKNIFGRYPKMWFAALTLIHELSHRLMKTKDLRYDYDGLKPGTSISAADSVNNADSWGYFAADMIGAIPEGDFKAVYK
jgi:hypothetical protein